MNIKIGGGSLTIFGIVLVLLKVFGHINWSWLWVLSPFWVPAGISLGLLGIFLGMMFLGLVATAILKIME